jgi:hypothetical protein
MRRCTTVLLTATLLVGCGGKDADKTQVREGAVVYRDALRDNHGGWVVEKDHLLFEAGRYQWRDLPQDIAPASLAHDVLAHRIPKGLAVSVAVEMGKGAALRAVACRELGPRDQDAQDWYELGIDGRQALIRRMAADGPPKVLARKAVKVPNGRRVRLTGQCVPDADGNLVLVLRVDGREVVRTRDTKPLPAMRDGVEGTPSIRAYTRPDSPGPATLVWDDFELRSATVK